MTDHLDSDSLIIAHMILLPENPSNQASVSSAWYFPCSYQISSSASRAESAHATKMESSCPYIPTQAQSHHESNFSTFFLQTTISLLQPVDQSSFSINAVRFTEHISINSHSASFVKFCRGSQITDKIEGHMK